MSAMKTHEMFNIVHGDSIQFENDKGEQTFEVKSIMVSRQQPSICQLFTQKENTGSLARETQVYHAKIETISPDTTTTDFSVRAKVGDEIQTLKLKTVRSESSDCCIC